MGDQWVRCVKGGVSVPPALDRESRAWVEWRVTAFESVTASTHAAKFERMTGVQIQQRQPKK